MSDWISANTRLRGRPFSMRGYEFQKAVCDDMHPNLDVKKCSQVGLTEIEIRKALAFLSRNQGTAAIFTLPDEKLYRKIAQTRIKPIVDRDKVFNLEADAEAVRSMAIIQLGSSWLYVTACSETDATSTSADAIFNDEVDLSPQDMLALFNSRLQNSSYRINQRFSTPSFPAFGIDLGFSSSDQRLYLHKCPACNHWNWAEFNRSFCHLPGLSAHIEDLFEIDDDAANEIDLDGAYVMCEKCQSPLGDDDLREWVPKYPNRTRARGYHVTPFSTSRLGLPYLVDQLLKYKKRDYIRGFYNTVLGATYSDSNTQITLENIDLACKRGTPNVSELPKDRALSIGIDMGQTCHVVIGDDTGEHVLLFLSIAADNLIDYVKKLFAEHRFVAGACDRLPYTPTANSLRDITKGIILPIQYQTLTAGATMLKEDEYKVLDYALMNRTRILDDVARSFREQTISLSGYAQQKQVVVEHLRDMVRDEKPEEPPVWRKNTGNDHYFHAIGYYKAALKLRALVNARSSTEIRTMSAYSFVTIGKQDKKDESRLAGFTRGEAALLNPR